jgi:DNA-binding PadR family transcriptional regulator
MNRISRKEVNLSHGVLKTLLGAPSSSIYKLKQELTENFGVTVNYTTLWRYVHKLVQQRLIRIVEGKKRDGSIDARGRKILNLTYKGLIYLVLNIELKDHEYQIAVDKAVTHSPFVKFPDDLSALVTSFSVTVIQKVFNDIKPQVNLDHFDEKYVKNLIDEKLVNEIIIIALQKSSSIQSTKFSRKRKSNKFDEATKRMFSSLLDPMKRVYKNSLLRKKQLERKIRLMKAFLEAVE